MNKRSRALAQNASNIIGESKYSYTELKPQEKRTGSKVNTVIRTNPKINNSGIFDKGFANEPMNPYSSNFNTQKHVSNKFDEEFDKYDSSKSAKTDKENEKLVKELEIAKKVINEKD